MGKWLGVIVMALLAGANPGATACGQTPDDAAAPLDGRDGRELLLRNFRPQPMLQVPRTLLTQARFPVIDLHTHFRVRLSHSREQLDEFVKLMDRNNIAICVSLDGQLGDSFREHADYLWKEHSRRFLIFANIDWRGDGRPDDPASWACQREEFARHTIQQLVEAKQLGASGVKVFKQFGLEYRNPDSSFLRIDDPRWDPIWQACGELGLPVLIHTADPAAFFLPVDETNERWEELSRRPEWSFPEGKFPRREELLAARNRVVERHPGTIFIGAHVANNSEDLAAVSAWLDKYPNLYIDFASRIGELGRQPYSARRFFMTHADRILFATDGPWPETRLRLYWRFLETFDEYFPYSEKEFPPQGFWNIYGLGLPDEVLRKIYFQNALRIIPGAAEKYR